MTTETPQKLQYRFKTKPYDHQVRALRKLISTGYGGALLCEPRTGKTKIAIDYMGTQSIKHGITRWIIVCPRRVMSVWQEEFDVHCPLTHRVVVWDAEARRRGWLPNQTPDAITVVLVNYEAFATPGKKLASGRRSQASGRFKHRNLLLKWARGAHKAGMVLDESHRIKSPSSKSATCIVPMGPHFARRVIMTGTPVTKAKRMSDIYMQWKFLNPQRFAFLGDHSEFKNRYGKWINIQGYEKYIGPTHYVGELHERIHRDAYAITRQECFDMPPPTPRNIIVPLTDSAKAYDEMAEEMIAKLANNEHVTAFNAAIQTLRLAQIASGVATVGEGKDKKLYRIGREKLDAIQVLLEESLEHEEKVIVAARFRADIVSVLALAKKLGFPLCLRLDGTVKPEQTGLDLKKFKQHEGAAVYVIQPQAGGVGIDLSTASRFIWFSLTNSWVDYTQCTDRVALNRHCDIVRILAEDTVDEIYVQALQADTDVGRMVLKRPEMLARGRH